jgi:hypothetical protein
MKGIDSHSPQITIKTIKAFEFFKNDYQYYDYIVRSNISTIINFDLLNEQLINNPIQYGGGRIANLHWIDLASGIKDDRYYGTRYATGTSIIFSQETMQRVLRNKHNINISIIDDLAIGLLFREHLTDIDLINLPSEAYVCTPNFDGDYDKIKEFIKPDSTIFYRNSSSGDRSIDCKQMTYIVNILLQLNGNITNLKPIYLKRLIMRR